MKKIILINLFLFVGCTEIIKHKNKDIFDIGISKEITEVTKSNKPFISSKSYRPTAFALSADKKYGITGGSSGIITFWDIETGRQLKNYMINDNTSSGLGMPKITDIITSPDNQYFITINYNGTIKFWDIKTAKEIKKRFKYQKFNPLNMHFKPNTIAITPDGKKLVSKSDDELIIWDVDSGKILYSIDLPFSITFSKNLIITADGKYIITPNQSEKSKDIFQLWDIRSGKAISKKAINIRDKHSIDSMVLSPDGRFILYTEIVGKNRASLKLWDIGAWREVKILSDNIRYANSVVSKVGEYALDFSQDGKYAIWAYKPYKRGAKVSLRVWDISNGKEINSVKKGKKIGTISIDNSYVPLAKRSYSHENLSFIYTYTDKISKKRVASNSKVKHKNSHILNNREIKLLDNGKIVLSLDREGVNLWDMNSGRHRVLFKKRGISKIATSTDGKFVVMGNRKQTIIYDIKKGKIITKINNNFKFNSPILSYYISSNNRYIVGSTRREIKKWSFDTGKETDSFKLKGHGDSTHIDSISFVDNHKALFTYQSGVSFKEAMKGMRGDVDVSSFVKQGIKVLDLERWKVVKMASFAKEKYGSTGIDSKKVVALPNGEEIIYPLLSTKEDGLDYYNYTSINLMKVGDDKRENICNIKGSVYNMDVSNDGKYLLIGGADGLLHLCDIENKKRLKTFRGDSSPINSIAINPNGKLAISSSVSSIKLWNMKEGKELLKMIKSSDDGWISIIPEGYFAGSYNTLKYLNMIEDTKNGVKPLKMTLLYDYFFRPDLVQLKLKEGSIKKYIGKETYQDILNTPPATVSFEKTVSRTDKKKIKVSFSAKDNGGGVGLIRIYQEGKLIQTIGEGVVNRQSANIDTVLAQEKLDTVQKENQKVHIASLQEDSDKSAFIPVTAYIPKTKVVTTTNIAGEYSIEVDLKSGKNEIAIEAFNKTNTVASYRESVTIDAKIPKRKPKLYAIVAGVNQFQSKAGKIKPLKYSVNDAEAIKEAVEQKMQKVFDNIEVVPLIGKDLTKANIYKSAKEISLKAHLEDTVLFYISTHGRSRGGRLYLVPYNNKSVENWIDFEQTFKAIQSIKALNQIFVIDACESGTADDIVSAVYDSKASVLAKSSGVHMLLATTRGTNAFESDDPKVKNGVFTHRILEALRSSGTDLNQDNFISIKEVSTELRKPQSNSEFQYPVIRNVGSDVRLERVE